MDGQVRPAQLIRSLKTCAKGDCEGCAYFPRKHCQDEMMLDAAKAIEEQTEKRT